MIHNKCKIYAELFPADSRTYKGDTAMKNLIPMYVKMQSILKDEKGATMVEYALMVALIAVVAMVAAGTLGTNVNGVFSNIAGKIAAP